ncbi:unnamed protein product, partial [marine sediment metagenome]
MKKIFIILLLLFVCCGTSFGTTFYVSTTGNDGNDGLGAGDGNAWKKLSYAILTGTPTGTHTINVLAGTHSSDTFINIGTGANSKT